ARRRRRGHVHRGVDPCPSDDDALEVRPTATLAKNRLVGRASYCHFQTAVPQLSPAPKPLITIVDPACTRPASMASHSATGMLAADVLPYRSTFENTIDSESFRRRTAASIIRVFAWCGISRSMSSVLSLAAWSACVTDSGSTRVANRNTSRPCILT